MAQELTMSVRIDSELWKRFARAADLTQQKPNALIAAFMEEFAERHMPSQMSFGFEPSSAHDDLNAQIDLEELLAVAT